MGRVRIVIGKVPDLRYTVMEEALPDGKFRTVSIEGTIRLSPGREPHSGRNRSPFDHHGHLIADQFGGPGHVDSGNVVPMHGHANNGAGGEYKEMENAVKKWMGDRDAHMKVKVGYQKPDDVRPYVFEVSVRYANGMHMNWRIFNFYPHFPNPHLQQN